MEPASAPVIQHMADTDMAQGFGQLLTSSLCQFTHSTATRGMQCQLLSHSSYECNAIWCIRAQHWLQLKPAIKSLNNKPALYT